MGRAKTNVAKPWILSAVKAHFGSRIPDNELVGRNARVIHMALKPREVHLYDGAHVLRGFLTKEAVERLDEDPDDLGILSKNLLGYLVAISGVTVIPDVFSVPHDVVAKIERVEPFCDRAQRPVETLKFVHQDLAIEKLLRDQRTALTEQFDRPIFEGNDDSVHEHSHPEPRLPPKDLLQNLHGFRWKISPQDLQSKSPKTLSRIAAEEDDAPFGNVIGAARDDSHVFWKGAQLVVNATNQIAHGNNTRPRNFQNKPATDVQNDQHEESDTEILTMVDVAVNENVSGEDGSAPLEGAAEKNCTSDVQQQSSMNQRQHSNCSMESPALSKQRSQESSANASDPRSTADSLGSNKTQTRQKRATGPESRHRANVSIKKARPAEPPQINSRSSPPTRRSERLRNKSIPKPMGNSPQHPQKVNYNNSKEGSGATSACAASQENDLSRASKDTAGSSSHGHNREATEGDNESSSDEEDDWYGSLKLPDTQHLDPEDDKEKFSQPHARNDSSIDGARNATAGSRDADSSQLEARTETEVITETPSKNVKDTQEASAHLYSVTRLAHEGSVSSPGSPRKRMRSEDRHRKQRMISDVGDSDQADLCSDNIASTNRKTHTSYPHRESVSKLPDSTHFPNRDLSDSSDAAGRKDRPWRATPTYRLERDMDGLRKLPPQTRSTKYRRSVASNDKSSNSSSRLADVATAHSRAKSNARQSEQSTVSRENQASCATSGKAPCASTSKNLEEPNLKLVLQRAQALMDRFHRIQNARRRDPWQVFLEPRSLLAAEPAAGPKSTVADLSGRTSNRQMTTESGSEPASSKGKVESRLPQTSAPLPTETGQHDDITHAPTQDDNVALSLQAAQESQSCLASRVQVNLKDAFDANAIASDAEGSMDASKRNSMDANKPRNSPAREAQLEEPNLIRGINCLQSSWHEQCHRSEDDLRYHFLPENDAELSTEDASVVKKVAKIVVKSFEAKFCRNPAV